MVYGTCLRILGNQADAEDAAQATFILFLKKCWKLKRDTILGGWLYRTAGFVSREFIRNSAHRKRREEQAHIMNESNNQETTQVWNELKPALDEALMALPAKHRDVVVLRYLEGKTNDEAATTLGMTATAVSTCLARALDKLRGHFQRRGIVVGTVLLSAALAEVLTFEEDQPMLTADFVDTLNLGPEELVRVNQILSKLRQEFLAVEKKQLGKVQVTEDPDGTNHLVIPPFHSERKALDKKLWAELGKVLNARQLRLVKQSNGLRARDSNLFDWGNATYSITIRKLAGGSEGTQLDYRHGIDGKIDGGWLGPKGNFSKAEKQLPDKYRRLLPE